MTGALGMPIGFALALVSFTYLVSLGRVSLTILPLVVFVIDDDESGRRGSS